MVITSLYLYSICIFVRSAMTSINGQLYPCQRISLRRATNDGQSQSWDILQSKLIESSQRSLFLASDVRTGRTRGCPTGVDCFFLRPIMSTLSVSTQNLEWFEAETSRYKDMLDVLSEDIYRAEFISYLPTLSRSQELILETIVGEIGFQF